MTKTEMREKLLELAEQIELNVGEGRFMPVVAEDAVLLRQVVETLKNEDSVS